MANYASLKTSIKNVIKTNGNNEITGQLLQQSLLSMINSLGAGYQFFGVATPTTQLDTFDQRIFYIAAEPGTYTSFDNIVLENGEIAILQYGTSWEKKTITVIAANSDESKLNALVDGLVSSSPGENIVDPAKLLYGGVINPDGSIDSSYSDAEYCLSGCIPVKGQNIIANAFLSSEGFGAFNVYDENGKFLRKISNTQQYTYQNGDAYVRICFRWLNDITNVRANYGTSLYKYDEFNPVYNYVRPIAEEITQLYFYLNTLFRPVESIPKMPFDSITFFYNDPNHAFTSWPLVRDYTGSFNIEYIIYKAETGASSFQLAHCYIQNGNFVFDGYETINLLPEYLDASLGSNVYKIPYFKLVDFIPGVFRFYCNVETTTDIGYAATGVRVDEIPLENKQRAIAFSIIGVAVGSKTDTILANKKIGFLGDSITEGAQFVNAFQQMTGCNAVNYGISGTHIAAVNASSTQAFENRVSSLADDLDAVVVFGGTNDFGHASTAQFGTFDDYTDPDKYSFYAGCHRMCKQLYNKFRGKPIIIMTPIHHGYEVDTAEYIFNSNGTITAGKNPTTGKTFKEYVDAIKQVAQFYSLDVIDAFSESGLNPCLETSDARYYFSDGLHLSQNGGNRLANFMVPLMEQIFRMFDKL